MSPIAVKLRSWAPWVTMGGVMLLLVGLAWDAVLHSLDSTLAEREGIFTLSNPGHILFAGGIAATVLGVLMYLSGRALEEQRKLAFIGSAAALLMLASASMALAAGTGNLGGPAHSHDDAAATSHSHTEANPANSSLPGVSHDHGEAVAITSDQVQAAQKLIEDTKTGTKRFEDINVALKEGYFLLAGSRDGLSHYHNQVYNSDGKILDSEHPEELIYLRFRDGSAKLVGVMYLMPNANEPGPRIGGPLTAWHAHDNLCINPALARITAFTDEKGKCPSGTVWMGKTPEMIHVWLVENPNGVFSDDMQPAALVALFNSQAGR